MTHALCFSHCLFIHFSHKIAWLLFMVTVRPCIWSKQVIVAIYNMSVCLFLVYPPLRHGGGRLNAHLLMLLSTMSGKQINQCLLQQAGVTMYTPLNSYSSVWDFPLCCSLNLYTCGKQKKGSSVCAVVVFNKKKVIFYSTEKPFLSVCVCVSVRLLHSWHPTGDSGLPNDVSTRGCMHTL